MTKSKNTKKALLASCLSMLLCVAMLVGSTFAWFTDSVTTGVNKIVAGNLDVELEYKDSNGKWQSAKDTTSLFRPTDGEDATLWEPGHTEYVEMRIRNAGSLALKYNFELNVSGDNEFKNVYGNQVKLSNFLVFNKLDTLPEEVKREDLWIVDQEAEKAAMGTSALAKFEKTDDKLLPDETLEFVLAVYMPTWVGNEANYPSTFFMGINATRKPEISLGFTLLATQDTVEKDSFDDQYDAKAWLGEVESATHDTDTNSWSVDSAAQLAWISENAEANNNYTGQTIKLTDNIDLNNLAWTPIDNFSGTFDGNGKTVRNINPKTTADEYTGFFGKINNGSVSDLTLTGGTVVSSKDRTGALAGQVVGANSKIENITVDGINITGKAYTGGLIGEAYQGKVTDCVIKNSTISGSQYVGGISGQGYANIKDTMVENCQILSSYRKVGGIVGQLNEGAFTFENLTVKNTVIQVPSGTSLSGSCAGGLIGFSNNGVKKLTNCQVIDCTLKLAPSSTGTLYGAAGMVGQVLGKSGTVFTFNDCEVSGLKVDGQSVDGLGCYLGNGYWRGFEDSEFNFSNCSAEITNINAQSSTNIGAFVGDGKDNTYNFTGTYTISGEISEAFGCKGSNITITGLE